MKSRRYIQIGWILLLTMLLLGLFVTPAGAKSTPKSAQKQAPATIDATIYLSTATLQPIFQSNIDAAIPGVVNSTISSVVGSLPQQDRNWATQMANTLIQPSANLVSLTPQKDGLATTLNIRLYSGDPKPINSSMLVTFKVLDSSNIQINAQSLNGSPALITGPVATFQVPFGTLNTVNTTPTCGDSALAVNLQFPVSLSQTAQSQTAPVQQAQKSGLTTLVQQQPMVSSTTAATTPTSAYVEIPATSLANLGSSIGSFNIDTNLTAKNIRIGVKGGNLTFASDVYLGTSFKLATAVTTVTPTAANGSLAVHVVSTDVTVFEIFTFPYNSYNQEIEQMLNTRLNGALAGKFTVDQAAIGPNSKLPCAASNSLVLNGTTSLS